MIEKFWYTACKQASVSDAVTSLWLNEIFARYRCEMRHYHNEKMLNFKFGLISSEYQTNSHLIFAIFFQYFEYDVREDCCERNCTAFRRFYHEAGIDDNDLLRKVLCLLGDRNAQIDCNEIESDIGLFQDLDLLIFGSNSTDYKNYSENLQKEYSQINALNYKTMRLKSNKFNNSKVDFRNKSLKRRNNTLQKLLNKSKSATRPKYKVSYTKKTPQRRQRQNDSDHESDCELIEKTQCVIVLDDDDTNDSIPDELESGEILDITEEAQSNTLTNNDNKKNDEISTTDDELLCDTLKEIELDLNKENVSIDKAVIDTSDNHIPKPNDIDTNVSKTDSLMLFFEDKTPGINKLPAPIYEVRSMDNLSKSINSKPNSLTSKSESDNKSNLSVNSSMNLTNQLQTCDLSTISTVPNNNCIPKTSTPRIKYTSRRKNITLSDISELEGSSMMFENDSPNKTDDSKITVIDISNDLKKRKLSDNNSEDNDSIIFVSETILPPAKRPIRQAQKIVQRSPTIQLKYIPIEKKTTEQNSKVKKTWQKFRDDTIPKPKNFNSQSVTGVYNATKETPVKGGKRMIIIDGSNVAFGHSCNNIFSVKGIQIILDFFEREGYEAKAVVPQKRLKKAMSSDRDALDKLHREGKIVLTPCKNLPGKCATSYDDRFIFQLAEEFDAAIISNDNFRDLIVEKAAWKEIVESRVIGYSFCKDMIMLPSDPYGKDGPTLDEILHRNI